MLPGRRLERRQELKRCTKNVCNMQIKSFAPLQNANFLCNTEKQQERSEINTKIWKFWRGFANMAANLPRKWLTMPSFSISSLFRDDDWIVNPHASLQSEIEIDVKCRRINYSANLWLPPHLYPYIAPTRNYKNLLAMSGICHTHAGRALCMFLHDISSW